MTHRHQLSAWSARRWGLSLGALSLIAGLALCSTRLLERRSAAADCEQAAARNDPRLAVERCLARYARISEPLDLVRAADAYLALGEDQRAAALAQQLIGASHPGHGHRIMSDVLLRSTPHAWSEARFHASASLRAFELAHDERGQLAASLSLAHATARQGDPSAALDASDRALRIAQHLGDRPREVMAQFLRADAFQRSGDLPGTATALRGATERAIEPCDRTWAYLRLGQYEIEHGSESLAARAVAKAEAANRTCGHPEAAAAIGRARNRLQRGDQRRG